MEVRKAYVSLAHVWDPNLHAGNPKLRQLAEQKRKEIDAAYNALQAFLPDLRTSPLADVDVAAAKPARPKNAIEDNLTIRSASHTRAYLLAFVIALIMAVCIMAALEFRRGMHEAKNEYDITVTDVK